MRPSHLPGISQAQHKRSPWASKALKWSACNAMDQGIPRNSDLTHVRAPSTCSFSFLWWTKETALLPLNPILLRQASRVHTIEIHFRSLTWCICKMWSTAYIPLQLYQHRQIQYDAVYKCIQSHYAFSTEPSRSSTQGGDHQQPN